jgi:hypothetical protein
MKYAVSNMIYVVAKIKAVNPASTRVSFGRQEPRGNARIGRSIVWMMIHDVVER